MVNVENLEIIIFAEKAERQCLTYQWNALKLLNNTGQFMTPEQNKEMLALLDKSEKEYSTWDKIGTITNYSEGIRKHMNDALNLEYIEKEKIKDRKFKVLVDCVNGAGVYCIPDLLSILDPGKF